MTTPKLTWLGHSTWMVETVDHTILVDPFLNQNPAAPIKAQEIESCDTILVTHGHFDHIDDCEAIAKRCGATVVTNYEIANWLTAQHGVNDPVGMNIGGTATMPWGKVKMVPAAHSSSLPDGTYGGLAAGFVMGIAGKKIYLAGDTGLFSDMQLIGPDLDAAILPIGDLFTMGVQDSIQAIGWLSPKTVLPCHYDTWPPIEQDSETWRQLVSSQTSATPIVLAPGQSHCL